MKLLTFTLLTLGLTFNAAQNSHATSPINNSKIQPHTLEQPYFKRLSNLKIDRQPIDDMISNFSVDINDLTLQTIRAEKFQFYSKARWTPPRIAFYSYRNFGIWDAPFLWYALENYEQEHFAAFFHHHENDPGIQLFESEVKRFSNIEPKYKNFFYRVQQSNTLNSTSNDYLPKGINASVALFEDASFYEYKQDDELTLGYIDSSYEKTELFCDEWKNNSSLTLSLQCTYSSDIEDKTEDFIVGETDSLIINSDLFADLTERYYVLPKINGVRYNKETLFLLAHKDSGITKLNDLQSTQHSATAVKESTSRTLKRLGKLLPEYNTLIQHDTVPGNQVYLKGVINRESPIVFITCDINNCPELDYISNREDANYEMIPFYFWQLNKEKDNMNNPIYSQSVVPFVYPNLQNPDIYNKHSIKHTSVHTYFIVSDYWFRYHTESIHKLENFLKSL